MAHPPTPTRGDARTEAQRGALENEEERREACLGHARWGTLLCLSCPPPRSAGAHCGRGGQASCSAGFVLSLPRLVTLGRFLSSPPAVGCAGGPDGPERAGTRVGLAHRRRDAPASLELAGPSGFSASTVLGAGDSLLLRGHTVWGTTSPISCGNQPRPHKRQAGDAENAPRGSLPPSLCRAEGQRQASSGGTVHFGERTTRTS